ncbi:MAG: hypothetical protein PHX75_00335 [Candidatus Methanomethylophilaceae archaeon]|nr:hypothetical protein [Candidatus Methanomethylophilaceae archaeon]
METKTKMLTFLVVTIMVAAGGIYFLEYGGDSNADITIACGTKNYYEPFWIADHYGYFEEQGVSVKMLYVDGGGSATTALMAGRADITLVGADPAVRFIDQTEDGMIIGSISVNKSSTAYDFAALTEYGVDLNDPAGTLLNSDGTVKVHTGTDTTTGYFGGYRGYLYSAWQDGKLTEDQYNLLRSVKSSDSDGGIVHLQFDSQVTALLQDEVQMLCSGNVLNVAKETGGDSVTILSSPYEDPVGACVIIASEKILEQKQDKVMKVMKAFYKACADIENPDTRWSVSEYCAEFYNVGGWTANSQKTFFESQYWNICMMKDIEDFLIRKAALLDYNDFDPAERIDYYFLDEIYGGSPYTYDPGTGTLV